MEKRIFLISHGGLAEGMANTLGMLAGSVENVTALGLMPGESPFDIASRIEKEILKYPEDRFFIMADLLGGSVSNAATGLTRYSNVRMINGMNLAAVIGLYFADADMDDRELDALLTEARSGLAQVKPETWMNTADEDDII